MGSENRKLFDINGVVYFSGQMRDYMQSYSTRATSRYATMDDEYYTLRVIAVCIFVHAANNCCILDGYMLEDYSWIAVCAAHSNKVASFEACLGPPHRARRFRIAKTAPSFGLCRPRGAPTSQPPTIAASCASPAAATPRTRTPGRPCLARQTALAASRSTSAYSAFRSMQSRVFTYLNSACRLCFEYTLIYRCTHV